MWDYTEKVLDHFRNPRNVGKIENPDGTGTVGSLACGDSLTLTFKLDENGKIADVKFQTFGCAMVSDAFFPFRDGAEVGIREGITSIVQPGGALRDWDVIDCCNDANVAMVFTGQRSFKH